MNPNDGKHDKRRIALVREGMADSDVDQLLAYVYTCPSVYQSFKTEATKTLLLNRGRVGAKAIAESLRAKYKIEINNKYISGLTRMFLIECPQHRDRFELRTLSGLKEAVQTSLELRGGKAA